MFLLSALFRAVTSSQEAFTMEDKGSSDAISDVPEEDIPDPWCNPDSPVRLQFEDITSAAFKIKSGVRYTPCLPSLLSEATGMDIYLKKEFMQYTGSFKERGARYSLMMLPDEQKKIGVVSASLGNHSQGMSYHGGKLNIPVTVVMPTCAPIMKIQRCRQFGANVVVKGKDMGEAKKIALKLAKDQGLVYINGYDHPHIMAGQGTIGIEILEQVENPDAVLVPVGGGGLIAGVAVAIKALSPKTKVIGVESERCAGFSNALSQGKPTYTPVQATLGDGLAVPVVGYNAYATAAPLIDKLVVVKEEWIAIAILRFIELEKSVVEGAGAIGLAAILSGCLDELKGKRVVLVLSGGNIDSTVLGRCLERGMAVDGRLQKISVIVNDRPGGISELVRVISSTGASIKDINQERAWLQSDIFSIEVTAVTETRNKEHAQELKSRLEENYKYVKFYEAELPKK